VAPGVVALVLFVAVLHVVWNAILKSSGDPLRTAERAVAAGVIVFAPAVAPYPVDRPPSVRPIGAQRYAACQDPRHRLHVLAPVGS